jgi:hypothetical protein
MAVFEGVDLAALKAELLNAHYTGMTDAAAAAELNKVPSWNATDKVARDLIPSYELFEAIVPSEWAAATAQEKQRVQMILGMGMVSVRGANTQQAFKDAFGAGTTTRANLIALVNRTCSRAEFLAPTLFPGGAARDVFYYDVARARAS